MELINEWNNDSFGRSNESKQYVLTDRKNPIIIQEKGYLTFSQNWNFLPCSVFLLRNIEVQMQDTIRKE